MAEPPSPEQRAESVGSGLGVTLAGALVGPAGAWLYETGQLDLFRAMPLLNVWLVVLSAVVGLCAGGAAVRRGHPWVGGLCLAINTAVLGLYGFPCELLLFRRFALNDVS